MRYITRIITLLAIASFLNGCIIGAGTHGKIKEYHFNNTNEEIVSIVDKFLLAYPEYYYAVDESSGPVYIKIPATNEKFGFRIGGHSEIALIAAGRKNESTRFESGLGYFEKKSLIKSFEKNFINKLTAIRPGKVKLLKDPFILVTNQNIDTVLWPHYVFSYDTLAAYPLPDEFDSTNIHDFEVLVLSFAKHSNQNIEINQYHNIFRISKEYSGYISDSIYITAYYRVTGQKKKYNPVFGQQSWPYYISKSNYANRQKDYKSIRADRIKNGYSETDVYSEEYSQELWMLNNNKLANRKGR